MMIWPEVARSLTARHDSSPCIDRGQNIVILCDQGGVRMDISKEVTSTLRANAESHPPVICVEYCGDRTDASCSTEKAYCIPKNPVDGRQQAVCFTQNQREEVRDLGGGYSESGQSYTLNTIDRHSVCYAVDCRNGELIREKSATLQAKGQGGWSVNVTNPVLMENEP